MQNWSSVPNSLWAVLLTALCTGLISRNFEKEENHYMYKKFGIRKQDTFHVQPTVILENRHVAISLKPIFTTSDVSMGHTKHGMSGRKKWSKPTICHIRKQPRLSVECECYLKHWVSSVPSREIKMDFYQDLLMHERKKNYWINFFLNIWKMCLEQSILKHRLHLYLKFTLNVRAKFKMK